MPFRNKASLIFRQFGFKCLLTPSPPQNGGFGGQRKQRGSKAYTLQRFRVEWLIDRLDILHRSGAIAFVNKKIKMAVAAMLNLTGSSSVQASDVTYGVLRLHTTFGSHISNHS